MFNGKLSRHYHLSQDFTYVKTFSRDIWRYRPVGGSAGPRGYPDPAGPSARPGPCGWFMIHAAIWVRELNPSLAMMLATCRAAVVWLMDSSSAMALLLRPLASSSAIWCSRWVSELGGAEATGMPRTT